VTIYYIYKNGHPSCIYEEKKLKLCMLDFLSTKNEKRYSKRVIIYVNRHILLNHIQYT
jgi:hypothetical protein